MKILLLNQCFYPDVVATAQQLTHLAVGLSERGHKVTVISSNRGYDDPSARFPKHEYWNGIDIVRISSLNPGKSSRLRRTLNFGSFLINCTLRLAFLRRFDVVVALTSPPLISLLGSLFTKLKGGRFIFWVMDLNPDEAVAAGWLRGRSFTARLLTSLLRYSLRNATEVVVLDRFVKQRILAKKTPEEKIIVLPPWSHDDSVRFDRQGRESFRARHGLEGKFVVMYSGNHSPCHSLDTLLEAARRLSNNVEFSFCFVGGGSEQVKVKLFAERHGLRTIKCLPYQSPGELSGSLSAADLHTVVMGDQFVGIVHPCKIYNILTVGIPFLYIGPAESHITDIATKLNGFPIYSTRHGDVDSVVANILTAAGRKRTVDPQQGSQMSNGFSKAILLPRMIEVIEDVKLGTEAQPALRSN